MNKQDLGILAAVSLAILALALGLFAVSEAGQVQDIEAMGVTNLSSLTLEDNLVVDGTSTLTGATTQTGAFTIAGLASLDGGIDVDSVFTVADATGLTTFPIGVAHIGTPAIASVNITYTAAAGGTGTVLTIAASTAIIVHDVWVETTTNFDAVGDDATLNIGDSDDEDGFCVLADAEIQAAYAAFTGAAAGWGCTTAATRGIYLDEAAASSWVGGMVYDATDAIIWTLAEGAGTTLDAGAATIWVLYTRIK